MKKNMILWVWQNSGTLSNLAAANSISLKGIATTTTAAQSMKRDCELATLVIITHFFSARFHSKHSPTTVTRRRRS